MTIPRPTDLHAWCGDSAPHAPHRSGDHMWCGGLAEDFAPDDHERAYPGVDLEDPYGEDGDWA